MLTKQIALQEYFRGAFKKIETSGDYKFLCTTFVLPHKRKNLYVLLVLKTLYIQLYHSSVDT